MINHELVKMEMEVYFISKFMNLQAQKHIHMLTVKRKKQYKN